MRPCLDICEADLILNLANRQRLDTGETYDHNVDH
jgi:hypothetical protein